MQYWLMKSEPSDVSVDDLAALPESTVGWYGVRNYQARNFMRDRMQPGDGVLFYHSSCAEPGVAGIAEVVGAPYPDPTQFDAGHRYFDAKASLEVPRWYQVDVHLLRKTRLLALAEIRLHPDLQGMRLLARGNRLSITPVSPAEWRTINALLA